MVSASCAPAYWVGIRLYYDKADLPQSQIVRNIPYDPSATDDHKRQLDLFLASGKDWPVVIFLHGGGWAWGDRSQKFGGADIYGNIGRFLASHGYGTAVPSYRLIWKVDWRTQAADVARAVAWVQQNIARHGGDPDRLFLIGHSAGAQLAMRMAVEPQWLEAAGGRRSGICGVIAVSGAGYDFEDEETRKLEPDKKYYVQRFGGSKDGEDDDGGWRRDASLSRALDASVPPVLVMLAEGDYPSLHRESRLLDERLRALGRSAGFVIVPGVDHQRVVLQLSRGDHTAGPAVLKFLRETACPRATATKGAKVTKDPKGS